MSMCRCCYKSLSDVDEEGLIAIKKNLHKFTKIVCILLYIYTIFIYSYIEICSKVLNNFRSIIMNKTHVKTQQFSKM